MKGIIRKSSNFSAPWQGKQAKACPNNTVYYTVIKVSDFKLNYSRPGRVWLVTSRLGTGKSITFFYSELVRERPLKRSLRGWTKPLLPKTSNFLTFHLLFLRYYCLSCALCRSFLFVCNFFEGWVACALTGCSSTLQRQNAENLKQIFPEKEYRGSVPISTFMCLWVNYTRIFPRWVCLFCWRKYVD